MSVKDIVDKVLSLISLFSSSAGCNEHSGEKSEACFALYELFRSSLIGMQRDREMAKRKIAYLLTRVDAARLYNSWYLGGGKVLGQQVPCTDVRLGGPSDLLNASQSSFSWFHRPSGWSKDRYDAAARHLATWDVDFEWTIAQHEAGAKFAAKNCKKGKPGENPFQSMCGDSRDSASSEKGAAPHENVQ